MGQDVLSPARGTDDDATDVRPDDAGRTVVRWLPGLLIAILSVWLLVSTDVTALDVLRYAAYWGLGVIVPGVIVHRVLRGQPARLLADLALGAATGLALEVLISVALSLVRADGLSRWWPLLVYGAVAVSANVRQAARSRPYVERESLGQAWATTAVSALVLAGLLGDFRRNPLPPQDATINIDVWWQLGNIQEMLKPGLPTDPRIAGEAFDYHWFSHIHLAVAGDSSGVDLATVLLRLWVVPVTLVAIALVLTLGRQVARTSWGGPLAVWVTFLALSSGFLWVGSSVPGGQPIVWASPSQTISLVVVGGAAVGLVDATRRRLGSRELAWLVVLTMGCVGMKPTATPVLVCATLLAAVAGSMVRRRVDWQLVGLSGLLVLELAMFMPIAGGTSGDITLLATLDRLSPYQQLISDGSPSATSSGLLLDSLVGPRAWAVALASLVLLLAGHAVRLLGLLTLVHPRSRRDVASWWLAGGFVAAWSALFLVDQPSGSQFYFLSTAAIFSSLVAVRFAAATLTDPDGTTWLTWPTTVMAVLGGAAIGWLARYSGTWLNDGQAFDVLDAIWIPLAIAALGTVAVVAAVHLVDLRRGIFSGVLGLLFVVTLGLGVPGNVGLATARARSIPDSPPDEVDTEHIDYLTAAEQEAALWLEANSDPLDVAATNLHCRSNQRSVPGCDNRGFWLSGLSGRRVLIEGWSYRPETLALQGVDGRAYPYQPAPWPERHELSLEVFTEPSQEVVDTLADDGVDWLVGVRRAGDVDAEGLSEFADLAFDNEQVWIWRIPAG